MIGIGERIKFVRGDESLPSFADKLGIHKNTLARYEKEESLPDVGVIIKICEIANDKDVTPGWLIEGDGPSPRLSHSEARQELRNRLKDIDSLEKAEQVVSSAGLTMKPSQLIDYIKGDYLPGDLDLEKLCVSVAFMDPEIVLRGVPSTFDIKKKKLTGWRVNQITSSASLLPGANSKAEISLPSASYFQKGSNVYGWPGGAYHFYGGYKDLYIATELFAEVKLILEEHNYSIKPERKESFMLLLFSIVRLATREELEIMNKLISEWIHRIEHDEGLAPE